MRGPQRDPSKPNSRARANGNRQTASTAYAHAQLQKVRASKPARPSSLSKAARPIWDSVVAELFEIGIITKLDATMLAEYCEQVAVVKALRKAITERIKDKADLKDLLDQVEKANKVALRLADSFGLTPRCRKAMGINTERAMGEGSTGAEPVGDPDFVFHGTTA